jgi:23S rRNA (cytosine1962-C5)-methyltransferase
MSLLKIRLTPNAERYVRQGHPWVYSQSIVDSSRPGATGDVAAIYDKKKDKLLALGLYDAESPLAIRILHVGKPVKVDTAWWRERMAATLEARRPLLAQLAASHTDGFRFINGESSGWPGLVADAYAGTLVMKIYSGAWLPYVPMLVELLQANAPGPHTAIVLRLARNIQAVAQERYQLTEGVIWGQTEDIVIFKENGLRFEAEVIRGQKTGFFLDQRDNRARVAEHAAGKHVLNAFSFSGGFSLYAARGGAASVTDLDISQHALDSARRNMALNPELAGVDHQQIKADCFHWLGQGPTAQYDLIICDPPSLAKREADRQRAIQAYHHLAAACWRRLRPGGLLVAASCSAHVSSEEFQSATTDATGRCTHLWTTHHAEDHAATFPEAQYLKCMALRKS